MDLDPRRLRHLLALHRHGSFVRAAQSLNLSQPALSVSIARLEDEVGRALVQRSRHGARLTRAGQDLARHAMALESVLATARDEMRLGAGGVEGPLRIGGSPLAVVSIIPDALARLASETGQLRVEVREAAEEALLAGLIGQQLDLLVSGPDWVPAHPEVLSKPLFRTRMILVMRPGHPLAHDAEVDLARLGSALWVLPPPGKGSFRTHVEAQFLSRGLSFPSLLIEADPFAAIIELVRRTDGVTLLSDPIVQRELAEGAVVGRPLLGAPPPRTFALRRLAARPLSGLAERFVRALEDAAPVYDQG